MKETFVANKISPTLFNFNAAKTWSETLSCPQQDIEWFKKWIPVRPDHQPLNLEQVNKNQPDFQSVAAAVVMSENNDQQDSIKLYTSITAHIN